MKKFGDEKWNGNRVEMERKWNGKFMKKVVDGKWNGNRVEMERIWNGKKERAMILANGFGNGMEWKRNGMEFWDHSCGISPWEFCEVFINSTWNRSIKFHSIP